MPCAAADCALEDAALDVQPCATCQRAVHHVCSNQFFDGDLSKRFCSDACVRVYHALEGGEYADAPAGSFDADGVPAHLSHNSPHRARDPVWSVIHTLKTPYVRISKSGAEQTKTHVCLLCTRDAAAQGRSATHWMSGLYNMPSTSNAKTHLLRAHKKHPITVAIAKGERETARAKRTKTRRVAADDAREEEEGDEDSTEQEPESDGDVENTGANDEAVLGGAASADGTFDADGVPVHIGHSKPVKARDPVWSVIHTLKTPFVRASKSGVERTKTHICLLCTRDVAKQGRSETQWMSGLYNMPSTSNAKTHVLRAHKKHPIAIAAATGNQATTEEEAGEEAAEQVSDGDEGEDDVVASGGGASAAGTFEADGVVFDTNGVPVHIGHSKPHKARDPVWSVIHTLKTPFVRASKSGVERTKTHICLLCTRDVAKQGRSATQWMSGLYNMPSTSNAKTHVLRAHKKHVPSEVTMDAERVVEQSPKKVPSHLGKRQLRERKATASVSQDSRPSPAKKKKKKESTVAPSQPSSELVNAMIANWLIEDGLPFGTVTSTAFKDMITMATGNTDLTIMSSDSFDLMLNAQFELFASTVKNFLSDQQERVHGEKFLTLIHDVRTGKNGTVLGASVAFIDHQWQFRRIALSASVEEDDSHLDAVEVAKLTDERAREVYAVDVESMTKFVVSGATASVRDAANHSPETQLENCGTRLLDQCIAYGVGLMEDTTSTQTYDAAANTLSTVELAVTPGGPLPQGASAIQKLRALNDYFCDEERLEALSRIQSALSLPVVGPLTDADEGQVASPCLLMRRSVLNYAAMREYFETVERLADNPFSCITSDDWQLICEMEGATNFMSELALAEAQKENKNLLASFTIVFRKMAETELKCQSFQCLTLATPKASTDETNQERVVVPLEDFSLPGKVCVERCLRQLESRFPPASLEETMILLLDPRTKDVAASVVDEMVTSGLPADTLVRKAREMLAGEHLRLFKAMRPNETSSSSTNTNNEDTRDAAPELTTRSRRRSLLFGAPVPITYDKEAEVVLQRWLDVDVDWARVAAEQSTTGQSEAEFRRMMSIKQGRSVVWDLLELYRQVDILRWFREEGEKSFPSIALLVRIWLGKVSSSAFHSRVFSNAADGGITVDPKHTRAENARGEKQLLLQHNRDSFPRPPCKLSWCEKWETTGARG